MSLSFFKKHYHPYYIYAPDYVQTSAGIRCLHSLCHALNELGAEAYLAPGGTTRPQLRTPALNREIVLEHYRQGMTPIAVYPEVIPGNPFGAPVVARWLLNKPGHLGVELQFRPDELVYYFQDWVLPHGISGRLLNLPTVDFSVFNNEDNPDDIARSGACYYAHKYLAFGGVVDNELKRSATSLCHDISRSPAEIAQILRRSEVLYCYEHSSIIPEAIACGCPVLIMPTEYWSANGSEGTDLNCYVRLASEEDALARAKQYMREYGPLTEQHFDYSWTHVRNFMQETQDTARQWLERIPRAGSSPAESASLGDYWAIHPAHRSVEVVDNFFTRLQRLPVQRDVRWEGRMSKELAAWLLRQTDAFLQETIGRLPTVASIVNAPSSAIMPISSDKEAALCVKLNRLRTAGNTSDVIALMETLTRGGSAQWQYYDELGGYYAEQGRLPEAVSVLRQGADIEPLTTRCLRKLAAVYTMQGDYGRILAACALILKREPDDPEIPLFLRDVLVSSAPSLDKLAWLDGGGSESNDEELHALRSFKNDAKAVFAEIRTRAQTLLTVSEDVSAADKELSVLIRRASFEYDKWVDTHTVHELDTRYFQEHVGKLWKSHPLFEFILLLRPGHEHWLADTLDSVAQQFFQGWRISIFASTPSPDPEFEDESGQIRWIQTAEETCAEAINQHMVRSPASWLGMFESGTQFPQKTLLVVGDYIALHPEWQMIYADDDMVDREGLRNAPRFKPDLNPDLLFSTDYIGSYFVSKAAFLRAGGYPKRCAGGERYDIALRVLDSSGEVAIGHIADVLYHVPSTVPREAEGGEAIESLGEHFARCGVDAEILPGLIPGRTRRIRYRHTTTPCVSLIIPVKNRLDQLGACLEAVLSRTAYPEWEILIVDGASDDPSLRAYYGHLSASLGDRLRIVERPGEFNLSAMHNLAAREARGEYLLFLNDGAAPVENDWLETLMSHAQRPSIGAVGLRLVNRDEPAKQHAGWVLGMNGIAGPIFAHPPRAEFDGLGVRASVEQNCSTLGGTCLLVRKSLYFDLNGMDETHCRLSHGDHDLCLRIAQRGYRLVWTPYASVEYREASRVAAALSPAEQGGGSPVLLGEAYEQARRWLPQLARDSAWNRNLSLAYSAPLTEGELAVSWNPDFHDRLRLLWMPLASAGQAEYRTFGPMRGLRDNAFAQCSAICQPRPGQDRAPSPVELERIAPDVLIIHAPVDDVRFVGLMHYKEINRNILRVYSLDDLITQIPVDSYVHRQLPAQLIAQRMKHGLAACDRLIVSTEPLREACREYIDDIRVVPNMLDADLWLPLVSKRRQGAKIRVGWAGGQQHAGDLRFLAEVVRATSAQVDWVFLGMAPQGVNEHIAEYHDFTAHYSEYPAKLAALDLDLAVAPLDPHPFNEAKSNLRLLEYGVLGWPVICSDAYPYRTGNPPVTRLKNEAKCWIEAILERAASPDALAAEGETLRQWVLKDYVLQAHLDVWVSALRP